MAATAKRPYPLAPAPARSGGAVAGRTTGAAVALLLLAALGLRLWLWDRAVGFEQGDPLEYLNIAYKLAFGIGIEWWDLRPLLLSLLYVPVLYAAQLWPDPTGEAMVRSLRLVSVLFGVGIVGLTYLLGRTLIDPIAGLVAGTLVAVNPVVNRMSVSTYAELPSTFFIMLGLLCLVAALDATPRRTLRLALAAGLALGAGCMIRYQAIFYLPPVGLWVATVALLAAGGGPAARIRSLLDVRGWSGALTVGLGAGLGLALVAQAVIELAAYGRPFHSLLASFEYNVTSGLAPVEFGEEPADWYVRQIPSWLGALTAGLAVVGAGAAALTPRRRAWSLLGAAGLMMFLALSWLPHKEERFLSQIVPLVALFAALGIVTVAALVGRGWTINRRKHQELFGAIGTNVMTVALLAGAAAPLVVSTLTLDLTANVGYVYGIKKAAELRPGATVGTIPWNVARPYAGTRLTLERMDRAIWNRPAEVARTIEQSDFLLFPEYWLLEDPAIDRLVEARFRSIDAYDDGVVLYERRPAEEPNRRRSR